MVIVTEFELNRSKVVFFYFLFSFHPEDVLNSDPKSEVLYNNCSLLLLQLILIQNRAKKDNKKNLNLVLLLN